MSCPQDNDEPFFQFDPYEGPDSSRSTDLSLSQGGEGHCPGDMSSREDLSTPEVVNDQEEHILDTVGKGKGVSKPMPIRPPTTVGNFHDLFDMLPSVSATSDTLSDPHFVSPFSSPPTQSSFNFYSTPIDDIQQGPILDDSMGFLRSPIDNPSLHDDIEPNLGKGKGKETELPPVLPPLTFSPTEFGYGETEWPAPGLIPSTPGPSSYGSGYGSVTKANSDSNPPSSPATQAVPPMIGSLPTLSRMPSRRRSLSNLSIHSTRSLTVRSMSRVKMKFGPSRIPSNLARKLLFRKREDISNLLHADHPINKSTQSRIIDSGEDNAGQSNCLMPWRIDSRSSVPSDVPFSYLNLDIGLNAESQTLPFSCGTRTFLRGKYRSNSSPLPFSTLDFVPVTSPEIFAPIPLFVRNYFDNVLPKELRLQILFELVTLHQTDHMRIIGDSHWTFVKASLSKNRWVGKEKGIRELVKLSRVSKSWQKLVFDGQLWVDCDLHAFRTVPKALLLRLAQMGGGFIRSLNFAGHVHLLSGTLIDITDNLCLKPVHPGTLPYTQLTAINLQGCSALTTRSLHHLLIHSQSLHSLSLKGLGAVTNTTCDVLAVYCPQLTSLDMSRCSNMDADGIRCLAAASIVRGEHLLLKELRLSGLKHASDAMMSTLGKAAPYLEVLDLSYVRQLHNSALEAFVSCEKDNEKLGVETIWLTARELGRDSNDSNDYRRRVTRLRHLSVSSCVLLTDIACSNLSHSLPRLEFLEMASIGSELKDGGLIRLLSTTPFIRRLDLEDASDITDSVIAAITPTSLSDSPTSSTTYSRSPVGEDLEPGHALEQLVISYANNVSDDALLALIRGCTRLSVLEVDNTRMGADVLKEFVRLSRNRQRVDSKIVAIDCRGVGENVVKELSGSTRPRKGWRAYDARKLKYLDGRDDVAEDLKVGQDECDGKRVVLKTFYSWQTVDAVASAREKRRKSISRRAANESNGSMTDSDEFSGRATRWWSPGIRRPSGSGLPPTMPDLNNDGCRIM